MEKERLRELAERAIEAYLETIKLVVNEMVHKIAEEYKIEDEDDIDYLRAKIMHGILKQNDL